MDDLKKLIKELDSLAINQSSLPNAHALQETKVIVIKRKVYANQNENRSFIQRIGENFRFITFLTSIINLVSTIFDIF